jgi:hypothetical protein
MIHGGLPSLRITPEESSGEDCTTSGTGRSLGSPTPPGCYVVTSTDPIIDTMNPENTLALQTIPTDMIQMAASQPGMELPQGQQQAYQVEQTV